MTGSSDTCAVCGASGANGTGLARVVIEGRALCVCQPHAAEVAMAMPATFDDLRALFVGLSAERAPRVEERRSPISRRDPEDRRVFPPRLEGRRMSSGRRTGDPRE